MNCKQGDLAVLIRSEFPERIGKITRCIKYINAEGVDTWQVDPPVGEDRFRRGSIVVGTWGRDSFLRPLRNDPGEDEILRIVGKPTTREYSNG